MPHRNRLTTQPKPTANSGVTTAKNTASKSRVIGLLSEFALLLVRLEDCINENTNDRPIAWTIEIVLIWKTGATNQLQRTFRAQPLSRELITIRTKAESFTRHPSFWSLSNSISLIFRKNSRKWGRWSRNSNQRHTENRPNLETLRLIQPVHLKVQGHILPTVFQVKQPIPAVLHVVIPETEGTIVYKLVYEIDSHSLFGVALP